MRRWWLGFSACALVLAGCSAQENDPTVIELRFGDYLADGHPSRVNWSEPFIERLKSRAGDELDVRVNYIGGGELVGVNDTFDAVHDGVVDMGSIVTNSVVDYLPIAGIAEVPGSLQEDSVQGSAALYEFLRTNAMEDFERQNLYPLMAYAVDPYNIVTADRRVETPSDLDGLVLRGGGGALNDGLDVLGAAPIEMSVSDAYLSLDRGTIDGTALGSISVASSRLFEVADHMTKNLRVGAASLLYVVNLDWWESLSPEAQDVVERAALDVQTSAPARIREQESLAYDRLEDEGMDVYEVADPEVWEDALDDQPREWARRMDDTGHDGHALLAQWRDLLAAAPRAKE